jgi:hypothetical protein
MQWPERCSNQALLFSIIVAVYDDRTILDRWLHSVTGQNGLVIPIKWHNSITDSRLTLIAATVQRRWKEKKGRLGNRPCSEWRLESVNNCGEASRGIGG